MRDLIVYNIGQLVTVRNKNKLVQGVDMNDVDILHDAYIIIKNGKFIEIGIGDGYLKYIERFPYIDAKGKLVTPGLIDSHTHLVHGGSREHEFAMKLNNVSYLDILNSGGGIFNTVQKTKDASFQELYNQAIKSLDRMLSFGVTTVEAKSGYGLELETEIKQLEVAKALDENHPIKVISTFMGAHAVPKVYKDKRNEYIDEIKKMLNIVREKKLATFCDVFCEEGVFSISESREILEYAKSLGFKLKIHADEIMHLGGGSLAAELGATSAEHLMNSDENDFKAMSKNNVVCNLLPLTSFYLDKPFAKARTMIYNGCGIAIATDYNPGSSPSENLLIAMQIAAIKMKLTPKEVITAVTMNAAVSLGLEKAKGSIEVDKDGDLVIFDCDNLDYLFYHFGVNLVDQVIISGVKVK